MHLDRIPIFVCILMVAVSGVAAGASDDGPAWPILHHELEVALEPASAELRATDTIRLSPTRDPRAPLHLLLHADLELSSARLGAQELAVESKPRWRPRDFWARPDYAELGAFSVARQHTVVAPEEGWPAEVELELNFSGAIYDSLRPPDVAYGRGFESTSGLIDPRGAFLSGETFWIPWTSEARFTFRLRTDLPAGWHSMAQGDRARSGEDEGRSWTVWNETRPQEQIHLVAGPYVIREREHRGVSIYTYTYENTGEEICESYLDATARYLDLYGERIGAYPFEKWALVENWWQTGFGMPGFTLLGDRVIRLPFIVDTSYGHEILHCWWGNGVYVDYARGNWCEGLTAFGADYFYKERQSEQAARDYRRDTLVGYLDFAASGEKDFPLRDFRERSDFGTQAVGYGKSLMVFQMLRDELGTEVFDRGLSTFYRDHLYQPASWADLATSFSAESGRDLGSWFAQWVDRPGAIDLSLGEVRPSGSGWEVELVQRGRPYTATVDLHLDSPAGPELRRVVVEGERTTVALPAATTSLAVDPLYKLFRRLYREEIPPTFSQALGADSSLVVIGRECSPDMADALREVGASWSRNQDMQIVEESELEGTMPAGRAVFVLGPGPLAREALASASSFGQEPGNAVERAKGSGQSVLFATRDPEDPERGWVVVLPATAAACEALGRKLPHYSRYSWLRFEGEENVGKGAWTVVDSPLHRELKGSGR